MILGMGRGAARREFNGFRATSPTAASCSTRPR